MSVESDDAWEGWLSGLPLDPTGQLHTSHSSAEIAWLAEDRGEWFQRCAALEKSLRDAGEHAGHAYVVAWGCTPPHLDVCSLRLHGKGCTVDAPCRRCMVLHEDDEWLKGEIL